MYCGRGGSHRGHVNYAQVQITFWDSMQTQRGHMFGGSRTSKKENPAEKAPVQKRLFLFVHYDITSYVCMVERHHKMNSLKLYRGEKKGCMFFSSLCV